ncbi:MAG: ABC transporter permease, partial [Methanomassiliicoccales archaeon]
HFQTLKNIYMAPISFYLYVVGRAVSKIIIVSVAVVITMAFGVLVLGLPLELTIVDWPMFAGARVIGLVCVAMLGVALAGISMLTARHGTGLNEAMAGMFYLFSGVIFPLTVLPDAGRWVGMAIPFTYWLEVMRRSLVPQLEIEQISGLAAYSGMEIMLLLLVSGAFFFLVSWGIFRYADHRARKKGKLDMITTY